MKSSLVTGGVAGLALALLVALSASGGEHQTGRGQVVHMVRTSSAVDRPPVQVSVPWPTGARRLAFYVNRAQRVIDDPASSSGDLAGAGFLEQLATVALVHDARRAREMTLAFLRPRAAGTMRTDLAAGAALSRLTVPRKQFQPWRIVRPLSPGTLLGYFRKAQSRFGVGWQYLAAIEFIETRFGRIHGPSSAGAQGPMQFLPATWARYGRGSIDNQPDAILAAARYLAANGAPGDMAGALYRYNNSPDYVAAVKDYADRMRVDPRAYVGYYNWQVLYARVDGLFLLPVGYPRVRPEPVHYP
jgi:hypothetical protein